MDTLPPTGILGNEEADTLTKLAHVSEETVVVYKTTHNRRKATSMKFSHITKI